MLGRSRSLQQPAAEAVRPPQGDAARRPVERGIRQAACAGRQARHHPVGAGLDVQRQTRSHLTDRNWQTAEVVTEHWRLSAHRLVEGLDRSG